MEKRIIAVVCVLILLVTTLVACGKKATIQVKEGNSYELVTDDEGNTLINADGDIVIYATDENGKYIKDSNGEKQTAAVTFPDVVVNKNIFQTAKYTMTFPEDWTCSKYGVGTKDSNSDVTLKVANIGDMSENETIDSFADEQLQSTTPLIESLKEKYPNAQLNTGSAYLTNKMLYSRIFELKLIDADNNLSYYQKCIWFEYEGDKYAVEYVCNAENSYDETFDVINWVTNNLIFK